MIHLHLHVQRIQRDHIQGLLHLHHVGIQLLYLHEELKKLRNLLLQRLLAIQLHFLVL